MTMLIDEHPQPSDQGPPGWTPIPQPTGQFPSFGSVSPSASSALHYAPAGSGTPGSVLQAGYAPPTVPTPAPAAPSVPSQGLSTSFTPTSMLLIVVLAVGGWYYYQHHQKPTPARPAVTQPSGPSSGQGTGAGATSLSQADAQLLTHVPTAIQSSCSASQLQGAEAAVECRTTDSSDNVVVIYGQFTSESLDTAFAAEAQGLHFLSVGDCPSGQCTYGGDGSANSGKVDYFSAQGDSGPMVGAVWTNTRTSILAMAAQNGTDVTPLLSWWENDAGPN